MAKVKTPFGTMNFGEDGGKEGVMAPSKSPGGTLQYFAVRPGIEPRTIEYFIPEESTIRGGALYRLARTLRLSQYHWAIAPDRRRSRTGLPSTATTDRAMAAIWTGEKRVPKSGEWYLSGAIVEAYYAPTDLLQQYHIARLVRIKAVIRVDLGEEVL